VEDITRRPIRMRIEAKPGECQALAERFEFARLHNLAANVTLLRRDWR
jgi:hypothetical protein